MIKLGRIRLQKRGLFRAYIGYVNSKPETSPPTFLLWPASKEHAGPDSEEQQAAVASVADRPVMA